jgi:site-specific recombinase XerD
LIGWLRARWFLLTRRILFVGLGTQFSKGVTAVLSSEEATTLLKGMDVSSVVGLRDRAIFAVMTYTFARAGAVVALNVEDYYSQKKRWWLRLHEKNGKLNEMPCHHTLEQFLDAYIEESGIEDDRKGPLFRVAIGKTKKLAAGQGYLVHGAPPRS